MLMQKKVTKYKHIFRHFNWEVYDEFLVIISVQKGQF